MSLETTLGRKCLASWIRPLLCTPHLHRDALPEGPSMGCHASRSTENGYAFIRLLLSTTHPFTQKALSHLYWFLLLLLFFAFPPAELSSSLKLRPGVHGPRIRLQHRTIAGAKSHTAFHVPGAPGAGRACGLVPEKPSAPTSSLTS